jgi:hypothetical protein
MAGSLMEVVAAISVALSAVAAVLGLQRKTDRMRVEGRNS